MIFCLNLRQRLRWELRSSSSRWVQAQLINCMSAPCGNQPEPDLQEWLCFLSLHTMFYSWELSLDIFSAFLFSSERNKSFFLICWRPDPITSQIPLDWSQTCSLVSCCMKWGQRTVISLIKLYYELLPGYIKNCFHTAIRAPFYSAITCFQAYLPREVFFCLFFSLVGI